ncbi:TPR repeat region-containing protein [Nocardiopsis prasina]|uniref:TPR repeat region-containing protein n=1 Tax=Nocardiopsis prasina TaxID=2015 RepID=UPI000349C0DD|nr:hypothetical protein [Nocardiopsis prasina]
MSLLNYTECEFDTGQIEKARDEFESLHAKIAGRSESYKSITSPVGDEFSDLIGDGLRQLATANQSAWGSALLACLHGYGVLDKTLTDTKWYNDEIDRIQARLASALNAIPVTDQDNFTRVRATREPFDREAAALWPKFVERCDATEEILKDGPTPRRIRELAEGGYFGLNEQAGYKSTGKLDFYAIEKDFNADLTIEHLYQAVVNGREGSIQMLESDPRTLALLDNMFHRAEEARRDGVPLSDRELAYLEEIYRVLGYGDDGGGDGFLRFADQVQNSDHISDGLRRDIQRGLANGMLVLSDEQVGGGMSKLPEDVREAANGPEMMPVSELTDDNTDEYMDAYREWGGDFSTLADFLDHSGPGVRGGTEFSTTLLGTTVKNVQLAQLYGREPEIEDYQTIVDVATRNDEANNIILTGKDFDGRTYEHHENHGGLTPEHALKVLYTVDWEDDGQAVRGLTDWIAHDADSSDAEARDRAGNAAEALIRILTQADEDGKVDPDAENPFLDTPVGDKGYDISIAEINPDVLKGLASVYGAYLDDISIDTSEFGYKKVGGTRDDLHLFHESGDTALHLPQGTHQKFLQLLLSNEEYSAPIVGMVETQERRILDTYLDHTQLGHQVAGTATADLRTAMSNALITEYTDRYDDVEEARTKADQMVQTGYNILIASTVQATGAKATPAGIALETFLRVMEQPTKDYFSERNKENIDFTYIEDMNDHLLGNPANIRNHANLQILEGMVDRGMVDMDTLEQEGLLVDDGDGGKRLPIAVAEWTSGTSGYTSAVERIVQDTDPEFGRLATDYITSFQEKYEEKLSEKWEE